MHLFCVQPLIRLRSWLRNLVVLYAFLSVPFPGFFRFSCYQFWIAAPASFTMPSCLLSHTRNFDYDSSIAFNKANTEREHESACPCEVLSVSLHILKEHVGGLIAHALARYVSGILHHGHPGQDKTVNADEEIYTPLTVLCLSI